MPNTMAALTFLRKGRLEWRDVPAPQLHGPDEALVRPIVASRCDGDCLFLFHDFSRALQLGAALHVIDPEVRELGDRPFAGPFAYGHECIAEVIDVGDAVRGVRIGQRVVVPWAISCGACGACGRGLTSHCERKASALAAYGFGGRTGGWGGMVSDVLRVPFADGMLVPVPAGVSPLTLAGASDNLPDAWRTVAPHLRAEPGAPVLVVGGAARSIGLYAAGIAVALGSSRVDYVDGDPANLAIAERLGANPIPLRPRARWLRGGLPPLPTRYPIAVDASNREAGLEFAIRGAGAGGRLHGRRLLLPLRDAAAALAHVSEGRAPARRRLESAGRPARRSRFDCQRPVRPDPRDGPHQPVGRVTGRVPRARPGQGGRGAPAGIPRAGLFGRGGRGVIEPGGRAPWR